MVFYLFKFVIIGFVKEPIRHETYKNDEKFQAYWW